jgi:2-polyprenyl-3-methyl-5-hydroxy-6-metoxy-1,4-benzoquinol methylase
MDVSFPSICPLCSETRRYLYDWKGYGLYRCVTCETESVHPLPGGEDLERFYQSISGKKMVRWEGRLELVRAAFDGYLERYRELTGVATPERFLDVGGGVGYYARAAEDRGVSAYVVDWADDALRFASRTLGVRKVVCANVQRCADVFRPRSFDFILARHTIEHVLDPQLFLAQLASALRRGGVLQIETPNTASREQLRHPGVMLASYRQIRAANPGMAAVPAAARTLGKSVSGVNPPKHLWGFTPKGLTLLLERHGFEVLRVESAVAGHPTFDPLFFDLHAERARSRFSAIASVWRRLVGPAFAGRGTNLAVTARHAETARAPAAADRPC